MSTTMSTRKATTAFFRPWNEIEDEQSHENQSVEQIEDDNVSVASTSASSSHSMHQGSDSSSSSNSNSSLNMLSQFVQCSPAASEDYNLSAYHHYPGNALMYSEAMMTFPSALHPYQANPFDLTHYSYAVRQVTREEEMRRTMRQLRPKKFKCSMCQVAFSNNGQLKGHMRIHTGERPFECTEEGCGKKFTRNEELTRHKRIHTGIRPYSCNVCEKSFGRKDHLKKHIRTHMSKHNECHFPAAVAALHYPAYPIPDAITMGFAFGA